MHIVCGLQILVLYLKTLNENIRKKSWFQGTMGKLLQLGLLDALLLVLSFMILCGSLYRILNR